MKKFFVAAVAGIAMLAACQNAFAQTSAPREEGPKIVFDSLAKDGTRYVHYITSPKVCSRAIDIVVTRKGVIKDVKFTRGCAGNTAGLCEVLKGMKVKTAIDKLEGTPCGKRGTSCPDQLATALRMIQEKPVK